MENNYDVGIANRFALFLEEGDSSLTAIRKKINKETRIKDKLTKKESVDTKKVESIKTPEKPKKLAESKPATNDVSPPKKEVKDKKIEVAKGKDKKVNDNAKRKEKEPQDKNRSNKVTETTPQENEVKEKDGNNKSADFAGNTRKNNYENRKNRDKKFENNDQFQSKTSPTSSKKFTKDDWNEKEGNGDNTTEHYQFEDNRQVRENGHGPYSDVKPRGGRFNRGNRGGRNQGYGGGDRRREFDQTNENKAEFDTNRNESNGEDKAEVNDENTENQKDDESKAAESDGTGEQKEVKEYLTLDEWKKLQSARQKPQYNLRKAGEGEDLTQWKNMRELQKKKDEAFLKNGNGSGSQSATTNENEDENAANENAQRVARQKKIDINVHFRDAPVRGRGGRVIRSNRFGYKGGNFEPNENFAGEPRPFRKPRDGPPSGRGGHRQNAPKMDDENAFPSLG